MYAIIAADVVDLLAVVSAAETTQPRPGDRLGNRIRGWSRQCRQIVVHPARRAGCDVKLVNVIVGADENDVLAAVNAPVALQRAI